MLPVIQEAFLAANLKRICVQIYRIVGNLSDAQDLTQETFLKALRCHEQLKDDAKAANWLSRIATNVAIDFLRRNGRRPFVELDEALAGNLESPEQLLLRADQRGRLDEGLRVLTARERTALLLRDVEDLPADEVAAAMGCSKATVRSHIANARIKLRAYLKTRTVEQPTARQAA